MAKELEKLGCNVVIKTLEVGDYVVSGKVAFERKTAEDLLKTWLDERKFFGQIKDLCAAYDHPILLAECMEMDLFTLRQVEPSSVQGMINTLAVSFHCPILYTLNPAGTARALMWAATREQVEYRRPIVLHGKRSKLKPAQLKEYVVSAVPDIGPVVSKNLLTRFRSVQAVFSAPQEDLMTVDQVGPAIAARIREVVGGEYIP